MTDATHRCSGCGVQFTRRGFLNHLHLSYDSRCASAWDRLQPTYPNTQNPETPPLSLEVDVEMVDATSTEPTIAPEEPHQTSAINIDIEMSFSEGDNVCDRRPQSALEEAPDIATHPSSSHVTVVFDSDEDDSDDDGDQDQTSRLEVEVPPSPRSIPDTETEQAAQTGKLVYDIRASSSDRIYQLVSSSHLRF